MHIIISGNNLEFMEQVQTELLNDMKNIKPDACQSASPEDFRKISETIKRNNPKETVIVFMASRIPGKEMETDEPALCDAFLEHIAALEPDTDLSKDPYLNDNIASLQFIDTTDKQTILQYLKQKITLFDHAKSMIKEILSNNGLEEIKPLEDQEDADLLVTYKDGSEQMLTLEEFVMDTLTHEDGMASILEHYLLHCYKPKEENSV